MDKTKLAPDYELVNNIKNNNDSANESVNLLLDRHGGLYTNIINSISTGCANQILNQDKHYILFKAAESYEPNKNVKFSTWFGNVARYHALNYVNREDKEKYHEPLESETSTYNSNSYTYEVRNFGDDSNVYIFNELKKLKDPRIEQIYRLRFIEELSWEEIGNKMNLSVMSCFNLFHKGKKIIQKLLK